MRRPTILEYNGRKFTADELSALTGIKRNTLLRRWTNHGLRGEKLVAPVYHTMKAETKRLVLDKHAARKRKRERLAAIMAEHARAFASPLGVYPLTRQERSAVEAMVKFSGQRMWAENGWYGL